MRLLNRYSGNIKLRQLKKWRVLVGEYYKGNKYRGNGVLASRECDWLKQSGGDDQDIE